MILLVWWETGKSLLIPRKINEITNLWKYDLEKHSYTQVTFGPGTGYETDDRSEKEKKSILSAVSEQEPL